MNVRIFMKKYIALFALLMMIALIPIDVLIVEEMYTHEAIIVETFSSEDIFTMRWIHSVELEPWEEIFTRNENMQVLLLKTRFKAFGAGVPDSAGEETYIEDDFVVYDKINQPIPDLTYGVSPIAKHTLITKNDTYNLYEILPADTGIRLKFEKVSIIKYLYYKII